mmetsp:Transcript_17822/g.19854  ORF Transcript_17822/g.19854 Transcript_17822/m.19854 type:complete len:229 (-) Transcript_17822:22-708(-)
MSFILYNRRLSSFRFGSAAFPKTHFLYYTTGSTNDPKPVSKLRRGFHLTLAIVFGTLAVNSFAKAVFGFPGLLNIQADVLNELVVRETDKILAEYPEERVAALSTKGRRLHELGYSKEALRVLKEAASLSNSSVPVGVRKEIVFWKAKSLVALQRYDESILEMNKLQRYGKLFTDYMDRVKAEKKKYETGELSSSEIEHWNPHNVHRKYERGFLHAFKGDESQNLPSL